VINNAKSYPLMWPGGIPRTKFPKPNTAFGPHTVKQCIDVIRAEVKRLGAAYLVISSNIPLQKNGDPYSVPKRLTDPGVAVYFQLDGKPYALPCDKWNAVEDNLWAIGKYIEAMRGMLRWGVGSVNQQFAGFRALETGYTEAWWEVLGCDRKSSLQTINERYYFLAKLEHPDMGGEHEAMVRLNQAREQGIKEIS